VIVPFNMDHVMRSMHESSAVTGQIWFHVRAALWLVRSNFRWMGWHFSSCNNSRLAKIYIYFLKHAVRTRAFLLKRHNGFQKWYIHVLNPVETSDDISNVNTSSLEKFVFLIF